MDGTVAFHQGVLSLYRWCSISFQSELSILENKASLTSNTSSRDDKTTGILHKRSQRAVYNCLSSKSSVGSILLPARSHGTKQRQDLDGTLGRSAFLWSHEICFSNVSLEQSCSILALWPFQTRWFFVVGAVLCMIGWLAASLAFTH